KRAKPVNPGDYDNSDCSRFETSLGFGSSRRTKGWSREPEANATDGRRRLQGCEGEHRHHREGQRPRSRPHRHAETQERATPAQPVQKALCGSWLRLTAVSAAE